MRRHWETLLVLAVQTVFLSARLYSGSRWRIFQERDYRRALDWWHGTPFWLGPEISGGGHLPGPAYYWIIMPPAGLEALGLPSDVHAVWLAFVTALAGLGLWFALKRRFGTFAASWVVFSLLTLRDLYLDYVTIMNSSYMPAFWIATLGLWLRATDGTVPESTRKRAWIAAAFVAAFSLQIHGDGVLLMAAPPLLALIQRRPWREIATWVGVAVLTVLPYALSSSPGAGAAILRVVTIWGEFVTYIRAGIRDEGWGGILRAISEFLFTGNPWQSASLCVGSVLVLGTLVRRERLERPYRLPELTTLLVASSLLVPYLLWEPRRVRYFVPFEILMTIAVTLAAALLAERRAGGRVVLAATAVAFAALDGWGGDHLARMKWLIFVLPLVGAALYYLLPPSVPRRERVALSALLWASLGLVLTTPIVETAVQYRSFGGNAWNSAQFAVHTRGETKAFRSLLTRIHRSTGWDVAEFRSRLYLVRIRLTSDLGASIREAIRRSGAKSGTPTRKNSPPDGFFLVKGWGSDGLPEKAALESLKDGLPNGIRGAIDQGWIRLGPPQFKGDLASVSYRVVRRDRFPDRIQNQGQPYRDDSARQLAKAQASDQPAMLWADPNETDPRQLIGLELKRGPQGVQATLRGMPLEQAHAVIAPEHSRMLNQFRLEFRCGTQVIANYEIEHLGGEALRGREFQSPRGDLLAPVHFSVADQCAGQAIDVRMSAESIYASRFVDVQTTVTWPGFSRKLRLAAIP